MEKEETWAKGGLPRPMASHLLEVILCNLRGERRKWESEKKTGRLGKNKGKGLPFLHLANCFPKKRGGHERQDGTRQNLTNKGKERKEIVLWQKLANVITGKN